MRTNTKALVLAFVCAAALVAAPVAMAATAAHGAGIHAAGGTHVGGTHTTGSAHGSGGLHTASGGHTGNGAHHSGHQVDGLGGSSSFSQSSSISSDFHQRVHLDEGTVLAALALGGGFGFGGAFFGVRDFGFPLEFQGFGSGLDGRLLTQGFGRGSFLVSDLGALEGLSGWPFGLGQTALTSYSSGTTVLAVTSAANDALVHDTAIVRAVELVEPGVERARLVDGATVLVIVLPDDAMSTVARI